MSRNHKFRVSLSASIGPPKYVIKIQDWPSLPWDWLKHRIFVFEDFIWIVQAIRNQNQMWRSHSVPPISLKVVRFCANLGLANCWKKTNSNFAYQMISPIFPQYVWTLSKLSRTPLTTLMQKNGKETYGPCRRSKRNYWPRMREKTSNNVALAKSPNWRRGACQVVKRPSFHCNIS